MEWLSRILGWGLVALGIAVVALDLGDFEIPSALWWALAVWTVVAITFVVVRGGTLVFEQEAS